MIITNDYEFMQNSFLILHYHYDSVYYLYFYNLMTIYTKN